MRNSFLLLIMLLTVAFTAWGATSSAHAQSASAIEFISLATEKCLDVASGSLNSGADVNQYDCHGGDNQHWNIHSSSRPGYAYIRNAKSGLCLDIRAGGPRDGTLQQYRCHYGDNQLFYLQQIGDSIGGVRIIVRGSGKCLDVPGGSDQNSLTIQQWSCHMGTNQRWLYAEGIDYEYPLVASPISRLDFLLTAGRTYQFELSPLPAGGAPVMTLWSDTYGAVTFNNGPANPQLSIINYRVPSGRSGLYRLFVHSKQWTIPGTATLTIFENGRRIQTRNNVAFGGTMVQVPTSNWVRKYVYETAFTPGGSTDSYLLALDARGRMVGYDDDSGPGKAARIADVNYVSWVVVGTQDGTKNVTFYINDRFRDQDGDGLGYGLERELQTCDLPQAQPDCRNTHNLHDTDRDGLTDRAEVLGIEANPAMHLAAWGANPRHKDLFVEVDYTDLYPQMPLTEADAEAIRDYFLVGSSGDLQNPDGRDGVAVHLDMGVNPANSANRTLFGDWGGSNRIPQDHPDKRSFRQAEREDVFFHAILHTGGQASGDGFGASLAGGSPRNNVRTFVHELGHTLNLEHEGGTGADPYGLNCSAIYPSIMNYVGQFSSGPWGDVGFADGTEYPGVTLNPARLYEAAGLGGADVSHLAGFGIPTQGTSVDWNRDGVIEPNSRPVRARVNWLPSQGCGTHIMGRYAQNEAVLTKGGSPSLAYTGNYLYLFYVSEEGKLVYTWGRQGTQYPESGCPHGQRGSADAEAKCTDWAPATTTVEQGSVTSVRAFAANNRLYVTYTKPETGVIQVLISTDMGTDGRVTGWQRTTIPNSQAVEAPALGIVYETRWGGQTVRLLQAIWPDTATKELRAAHVDLLNQPFGFTSRATPQDSSGNPLVTNGAPVTLTFWGEDRAGSPTVNQSWMALADSASRIRIYYYDAAIKQWHDRTNAVFPTRPTGEVEQRMGFAFRPLLDANGRTLHPLKGEFTLIYGARNEGGVGTIWISDVVDQARPPQQALTFPRSLAGRFGHAWYGIATQNQGGFDLFASPTFPFLKGAAVISDRRIAFLAYADGTFDLTFRTGSDFAVMERGICNGLHDGNGSVCDSTPVTTSAPLGLNESIPIEELLLENTDQAGMNNAIYLPLVQR